MPAVLSVTLPVFLLIGLGWAARAAGVTPAADMEAIGRLVLRIGLPALVFDALAGAPLARAVDPGFLAAYAAGSLAVFGLGFVRARLRRAPLGVAALHGLGMSGSNSGFVGYPLAVMAIGEAAGPMLAQCMIVENLLMIPLTIALAEAGGGAGQGRAAVLLAIGRGLGRSPVVLALAAGLAVSASGLALPEAAGRAVELLAALAAPAALFVIGGTIAGLGPGEARSDLGWLVAGKLVLHPLAVLVALLAVPGIDGPTLAGGVLFAALPMMGLFPFLGALYGAARLAAGAMVVATLLSFPTLSGLVWALGALGLIAPG